MYVTVRGFDLEIDANRIAEPWAEIRRQVREYDRGERRTFDLTVEFPASFAGRVMAAMAAIPYGETRTYGDIAEDLGTAPVPVGSACGRNPVPVVVPCHRVVGSDSLGGFSAEGGVEAKRALLDHERAPGLVQSDLGAFR
ncbi:MAG: methylated-DNA--[protein]-cysteine S-methyltransferase [Haloarculaceae archaeon]